MTKKAKTRLDGTTRAKNLGTAIIISIAYTFMLGVIFIFAWDWLYGASLWTAKLIEDSFLLSFAISIPFATLDYFRHEKR